MNLYTWNFGIMCAIDERNLCRSKPLFSYPFYLVFVFVLVIIYFVILIPFLVLVSFIIILSLDPFS